MFCVHKLSPGSRVGRTAALRFLFIKTLRRPYLPNHIPFPKRQRRLPSWAPCPPAHLKQTAEALLITLSATVPIANMPYTLRIEGTQGLGLTLPYSSAQAGSF